ncbi:MAG: amidase family protein [Candidatus Hodgkinia cicadicola]
MKAVNALCKNDSTIAFRLCLAFVQRAERLNWYFGINSACGFERALACARTFCKARSNALFGTYVGIKELLLSKGGFTEASSMILSRFVSKQDAEVVLRLKRAGATMLCRANMDEFGIGYIGGACAHGYVVNAWARAALAGTTQATMSGGSSGGCATAVALRVVTAALATDTGGSTRQPASYVGVIGLKPSYGRCSRWGVLAYASSLDQVGVLTRNACDCARVCCAIFGLDPKDWTSASLPVPKYNLYTSGLSLAFSLNKYCVSGLVLTQHSPNITSVWTYCLAALARVGFKLTNINMPYANTIMPCYLILSSVECCSNLARYDGIKFGLKFRETNSFDLYKKLRTVAYSSEVKRKLLTGAYILATRFGYDRYYLKAQKLRFIIKSCLLARLGSRNMLIAPSVPASKLDAECAMQLSAVADVYTVLANLTGLPSVNVPVCFGRVGLPFGIQLTAGAYRELELIAVASGLVNVCGALGLRC